MKDTNVKKYGIMTRQQALASARRFHGNLGTISSDERKPFLVWKIGEFGRTIGRGRTWEEALRNTRPGRKIEKDEEEAA